MKPTDLMKSLVYPLGRFHTLSAVLRQSRPDIERLLLKNSSRPLQVAEGAANDPEPTFADPALAGARDPLLLVGAEVLDVESYEGILAMEAAAQAQDYKELR